MKKYSIETERLYLHPLTYEQLKLYLQNDGTLEKELGIEWKHREIHPELKEALENTLLPSVAHNINYHFFTLWTMISKEHNCMIGDLCFKGAPCEDGSVEIGYGIYPAFEKKGIYNRSGGGVMPLGPGSKICTFGKGGNQQRKYCFAKSITEKWFCVYG